MSFWVNYRSTPARVALPVTTFLALTGITDQIRSKVHLIGGTDILEVYLNVSMLFVYGVIVEYGIVGITDRIWSKQEVNDTFFHGRRVGWSHTQR